MPSFVGTTTPQTGKSHSKNGLLSFYSTKSEAVIPDSALPSNPKRALSNCRSSRTISFVTGRS